MITGEHEFEASHGLPERLPTGERLLWQGRPDTARLAREALHGRKLAIYFAVLLAWRATTVLADGGTWLQALTAAAWLLPLAFLAVGIAYGLAVLAARSTVYTLTDRRIVMRIGIVLTLTFNLPLRQIDAAVLRVGRDDHGDIALTLARGNRIGYIHLWPHARPWELKSPQPMLRAIPDARRVAAMLTRALQASAAAAPASANVVSLPTSAGASGGMPTTPMSSPALVPALNVTQAA